MRMQSIPLTLALWTTLYLTASHGQENPPERLDTITLRHQVILHSFSAPSDAPNNGTSGRAILWTSSGFGTVLLDDAALPRVWKLLDNAGNRKPYSWFRITNDNNGSLDDYWFCEPVTWDTYALDGDVSKLKTNAWHFMHYNLSSAYTPPPVVEPVTWEDRTEHLTVGYTTDHTLIVIKLNDETGIWEWSVRGPRGTNSWTNAINKTAAKATAESSLQE